MSRKGKENGFLVEATAWEKALRRSMDAEEGARG